MDRRLIIAAFAFLCVVSCGEYAQESTEPCKWERICGVIDSLADCGQNREAISIGRTAFAGTEDEEAMVRVRLGARLGRLYYMESMPDSMYFFFNAVTDDADRLEMYSESMMIHNVTGVYNLLNALDYENALFHFQQGLECAGKSGDEDFLHKLLVNISIIHYMRKDPAGITTSQEIYDYGKRTHNNYFSYTGALMFAYMYHSLGKDGQALDYVTEAAQWPEYSSGPNSLEPLKGSILAALGRDDEAERTFLMCLNDPEVSDGTVLIELHMNYGKYLTSKRRYREAEEHYLKGLSTAENNGMHFYAYSMYEELANLASAAGEYEKAVKWLGRYNEMKNDVFNVEKERSFNNLIRQYENQKNAMEIQKRDMELLKQRQLIRLILVIFVLAAVAVAAVAARIRTRNRMYRQLVSKYNAYLERERMIMERFSENRRDSGSEVIKQMFDRLETLMKDERLYAEKNLTIEDVASRLGTNRSYLSKAVNTYAGASFNSYLNSIRIKESIKMLSDPENDAPIKQIADAVGYSNITSFYNNFTKETGVPPSRFRAETTGKSQPEHSKSSNYTFFE